MANAHQALLIAISNFGPSESPALKAALARALRTLTAAIAEVVGPSQWGLQTHIADIQDEARTALESIFQVRHFESHLSHTLMTHLSFSLLPLTYTSRCSWTLLLRLALPLRSFWACHYVYMCIVKQCQNGSLLQNDTRKSKVSEAGRRLMPQVLLVGREVGSRDN